MSQISTDANGKTAAQRERDALREVVGHQRRAYGLLLVLLILAAAAVALVPWVAVNA